MSIEERLQLQCAAAEDARELLRLCSSRDTSGNATTQPVVKVDVATPSPLLETSAGRLESEEHAKKTGHLSDALTRREATKLVEQIEMLMPPEKTDWVFSA